MGNGDNTYDFMDIPRLLEPLKKGEADLVLGSRFKGEIKKGAMPWHHQYIGNPFLTWLFNKALFRAAMGYAKHGRSIVNGMLVEKLFGFIERLKETKGMRIFKFRRGFKKAVEMLEKGEEKGVFVWAPSLKKWLKDPDYVFWLGTVRR
jgi:hypothetical protein